jgi:probable phosphoglycerate mutase
VRDFSITSGATEILLIRHAEAQHPKPGEFQNPAHLDLSLSERGRAQARVLADRLARRALAAVYASPLLRTRETADALAAACGLDVREDVRLREIEIGKAGSVSLDDLAEIAIAKGGWSHLEGTESSQSIRHRMRTALDEIATAHAGQRVAVVSHAGSINAYIANLLGLAHDFFFPAGNTSISVVRARAERRLIVSLNDIAHLEAMRRAHA